MLRPGAPKGEGRLAGSRRAAPGIARPRRKSPAFETAEGRRCSPETLILQPDAV
jgi:hypothetical protein